MSANYGTNGENGSVLKKIAEYIPLLVFVGFGGMLVQRVNSNERESERRMTVIELRIADLEANRITQLVAMRDLTSALNGIKDQLQENTRRWEQWLGYPGKPKP